MEREKNTEKLEELLKTIAEQCGGKTLEIATEIYSQLLENYQRLGVEAVEDVATPHWFSYKTELEKDLLIRLFYTVTGSTEYYTYAAPYSRRKKRCCDCTEREAAEIQMLFLLHARKMEWELGMFKKELWRKNNLFPDETARCYEEPGKNDREYSTEKIKMMLKETMEYWKYTDPSKFLSEITDDGQQATEKA